MRKNRPSFWIGVSGTRFHRNEIHASCFSETDWSMLYGLRKPFVDFFFIFFPPGLTSSSRPYRNFSKGECWPLSSIHIDRGSSVIVKNSFVWKLSNIQEFEYVWPRFQISWIWEVQDLSVLFERGRWVFTRGLEYIYGFWFLVCYEVTQLATQLRQRCIQVVCSKKEAQKRLTESNGTPAMDLGHMNVVLK